MALKQYKPNTPPAVAASKASAEQQKRCVFASTTQYKGS